MHKSIKQYPPHCSCSALTTRDNYLTVRTTNVKLEGDMRKKGEGAEVGTCSPLTSTTVNWSPKSLNTCAYKPFTSAMISWMPSQREDLPKIHLTFTLLVSMCILTVKVVRGNFWNLKRELKNYDQRPVKNEKGNKLKIIIK